LCYNGESTLPTKGVIKLFGKLLEAKVIYIKKRHLHQMHDLFGSNKYGYSTLGSDCIWIKDQNIINNLTSVFKEKELFEDIGPIEEEGGNFGHVYTCYNINVISEDMKNIIFIMHVRENYANVLSGENWNNIRGYKYTGDIKLQDQIEAICKNLPKDYKIY